MPLFNSFCYSDEHSAIPVIVDEELYDFLTPTSIMKALTQHYIFNTFQVYINAIMDRGFSV
jgi:hypothetical protein